MTATVTRLHISPLTPETLPVVLGSNLVQLAQNISYHAIQTFPENSYGFIEIPTVNAEKLKKKLHDAILRGRKMKVEDAHPKKRRRVETEDTPTSSDRKLRNSKPSKRDTNAIPGCELSPDRKVKRGWTEPKAERRKKNSRDKPKLKTQAPSKYTEKEELLFRTRLPPNREEIETDVKKRKLKKSKKDLVHEFEKASIQPAFLRDRQDERSKGAAEYQDGRGWIDADDNVIEGEPATVVNSKKRTRPTPEQEKEEKTRNPSVSSDSDSGSIQSSSEVEEAGPEASEDETSSSGISSSSSNTETQGSPKTPRIERPQEITWTAKTPSPKASTQDSQDNLHPLEALFKKPRRPISSQDVAKPSLEVATSFSFFDQLDAESTGQEPVVPGTPFTFQDLRSRGIRSAAPTPDTAHPSRFSSYHSSITPESTSEADEDGAKDLQSGNTSEEATLPSQQSVKSEALQPSDFEKKFWERRGENNRAWKARKKAALKEKRQRENRLRRPRNW